MQCGGAASETGICDVCLSELTARHGMPTRADMDKLKRSIIELESGDEYADYDFPCGY